MKNTRLIIVVFAFFFVAAFAAKTPAQITGGYNSADAKSKEVKSAAVFAVADEARKTKTHLKFIAVSQAEQQVVAGLNYKVCLKVRDGKKSRTATAVVYQNLKQKLSLTSWVWDKCEMN